MMFLSEGEVGRGRGRERDEKGGGFGGEGEKVESELCRGGSQRNGQDWMYCHS